MFVNGCDRTNGFVCLHKFLRYCKRHSVCVCALCALDVAAGEEER